MPNVALQLLLPWQPQVKFKFYFLRHRLRTDVNAQTVKAAHWVQIEQPAEVNAAMKEWLDQYYPALKQEPEGHAKDEL